MEDRVPTICERTEHYYHRSVFKRLSDGKEGLIRYCASCGFIPGKINWNFKERPMI